MAYITVDAGEFTYQVWVDDPVPARSDPELPQPSPPQQVQSNSPPPSVPVVPGTLNASGNPQFVLGTPEYVQAEQLARQQSREDLRRAARDYGVDFIIGDGTLGPGSATITAVVGDRVFLDLPNGQSVDITSYFEGNPKPPVAIDISVPTYGTSTVTTPFRNVTVTALPEVARTVSTSEGNIVVDANSETARLIQWKGSQPGIDGRPLRETWARAGISDPYSNPAIVGQAVEQIERADARKALFNQSGVTPPGSTIAPWNDPNWPAYQGSNREAYTLASAALTDTNVKNQLKAENGWDEATFQSWALRATNPEEAGRQAAAFDAANGIVAGPSSGTTTGLSANGATAVTTTGAVNAQGFSVSSASSVATNQSPPSIDTFVANYWKAGQAGDSGPFAGGTLQRLNATNAVFIKGKDYYYIDNRSTVDELANIPGFIAAIEANIGAVPQTGDTVLTNAAGQATGVRDNATGVVTGVVAAAGAVAVNAAGAVDAATGGLVTTATGAVNTATNIVNTAIPVATAALAGFASAATAADAAQSLISGAVKSAVALPSSLSPFVTAATDAFSAAASTGLTTVENLFSGQAATLLLAKNQATLQARNNEAATADWRVRLQLGTQADYLYKDAEPGILAPLYDTDGVIFPYMPTIETSYAANYDKFDLTHSNYRGYFYKGSNVNDINLRATFTAQDTQEANYLLAVIHFFRSVTKMFYGQDAYRGAPPPLVFLNGLGNYQFNEHPCFVSNFSYSLPNDVDYIRAQAPNNYGNLFSKRERTGSTSGGLLGSVATRLLGAGLNTVNPTMPNVPTPGMIQSNVTNINDATYVPTKMEINITLLPTNTRAQVSQQFSLKAFANGNLLKGGFW